MITLKKSNIYRAGDGVFAVEPIAISTIICKYDGIDIDSIPQDIERVRYTMANPKGGFRIGQRLINGYPSGGLINDSLAFVFNDKWRNPVNGCFSMKLLQRPINIYKSISENKANVAFIDDNFTMGAIRDIEPNEELYISYGIYYWISLEHLTTDEPMTRLVCRMLLGIISIDLNTNYITSNGSIISTDIEAVNIMLSLSIKTDGEIVKMLGFNKYAPLQQLSQLVQLCL